MNRYSRQPDEYDLEQSYQLSRRLDRDEEREPRCYEARPPRRRLRYFSGLMFRPVVATADVAGELKRAS